MLKDLIKHTVIMNREIETIKKKQMSEKKKNTTTPVTHMLDGIMSKLNTIEANKIEPENIALAIMLKKRETLKKFNELSISICLKHP